MTCARRSAAPTRARRCRPWPAKGMNDAGGRMTQYGELLAVAAEIAGAAGRLLADGRPAGRLAVESKSSPTDVVTAMDRAAEALIAEELARLRPDDGLIGEEGAARVGTSGVH